MKVFYWICKFFQFGCLILSTLAVYEGLFLHATYQLVLAFYFLYMSHTFEDKSV